MPEVIGFPDCCGFIVVNKFKGGHPGANPDDCVSPEALVKYLTKQEQEYYGKRAGLLAVLSQPQDDQIGEVFLERKWVKLLPKGIMNPRTGVRLHIYMRDLNPSVMREKRIFGK